MSVCVCMFICVCVCVCGLVGEVGSEIGRIKKKMIIVEYKYKERYKRKRNRSEKGGVAC